MAAASIAKPFVRHVDSGLSPVGADYSEPIGMAVFAITLDHFQPDCTGCKWSNPLFDRMIHTL
jgi:hypothetical protein